MPRAEAKLLAIEDDSSLVLALNCFGSLGGCIVVSGEGGLVDSCFGGACDCAPLSLSLEATGSGRSLTMGFSCASRSNRPNLLWCCSSKFKTRSASESDVVSAAAANSAAARSCSSLAATGL
jgi:hypothetical protein